MRIFKRAALAAVVVTAVALGSAGVAVEPAAAEDGAATRSGAGTRAVATLGSAAGSAGAVEQSCSYGTGAAPANGLCWLDFSDYRDELALSADGQRFATAVPGGYTMTYTLKRTVSPADWSSWSAKPVPIFPSHPLGNAYTGIAGLPQLYPDSPKGDDGTAVTVTFRLSDVRVADAAGRAVPGYTLSVADAEVLNDSESYTWTTDGNPWQVQARLGAGPVCGHGLTGTGSANLTCAGPDASTLDVGALVASTSGGPTQLQIADRELHGSQGFAIAIDTATIQVTKKIAFRAETTDQFTVAVLDEPGTSVVSATTAGAGLTAGIEPTPVLAGSRYTLTDEGDAATLGAAYLATWACANGAGDATVLPAGAAARASVTPAAADRISCTVTNTPIAPSALALTGGTPVPESFARGNTVSLTGNVTSNYALTEVTATITGAADAVAWSKSAHPASKAFNLAVWDDDVVFRALQPGDYTYSVTAEDASGTRKTLQTAAFTVTPPANLAIAGSTVIPAWFAGLDEARHAR